MTPKVRLPKPLRTIADVEGYLYEPEAYLLYDLARAVRRGCIVELGSYRGRSTIMLAQGARESGAAFYAIDPHFEALDGIATYGASDRAAFMGNVLKAGCGEIVRKIDLPSYALASSWHEPIGLLWIDAAHDYASVKRDFEQWSTHVLPGGIVAFHDSTMPGVSQLQSELPGAWSLVETVNSTRVYQKQTFDVSVLIPAYNCVDTIGAAIDSAIAQEGVNVQVIITDDGSTDNVFRLLDRFIKDNPKGAVHGIVHRTNRGQAAALNTCGEHASGRYFIELDSDDTLAPGALAALVTALDNAPPTVGFAYGCTLYSGEIAGNYVPPAFKSTDFYHSFPSLYAFMYRREAWDAGCRYQVHATIDGHDLTIQDWDMALQLMEHMRYDGLALRDTLVLHHRYTSGGEGAQLKARQDILLQAFKQRWPKVEATGL